MIKSKQVRARLVPDEALPKAWPAALRRVLSARGIQQPSQLQLDLAGLLRPDQLGGVQHAAQRLADVVEQQGRVLVVGDFDADGATATALCLRALRAMGLASVDYCVPNRFLQGYGLSPALVDAYAGPAPDLLLTVDNGISSHAGVAAAKAKGWPVIITDHHLPGETLPDAEAIVNPCLHGSRFPSKALAGVGVVFYLLAALRQELQSRGWFAGGRTAPRLADWLDLVALGTVADLVPLDDNNRILVKQGLERIRQGKCAPGLLALIDVAGRSPGFLTAADLGFAVAPRLNAAGRLEDMGVGIECLTTDDSVRAAELASALDQLNQQRRRLQEDMQEEALKDLAELQEQLQRRKSLPSALCLYREDWHQGVVGLVASRIKERLHRPVFAFAREQQGSATLKGSGRSVSGVHLRDLLAAVDTQHPGLIERFGGHAMAAGLSLAESSLPAFERALDEIASQHIDAEHLQRIVVTDGALAADELELDFALQLESILPWGQGCPEPLFDNTFEVLDRQWLKNKHLKLWLSVGQQQVEAIAFDVAEYARWVEGQNRLRLLYLPTINRFRGRQRLQLRITHLLAPDSAES